MSQKQIILRPTSSGTIIYQRRQPFLRYESTSSSSERMAEMAGGTIAGCTAVWCCGPCTVVNFLIFLAYKVPSGICKKALKNQYRRRLYEKGLLPLPSLPNSTSHCNHLVEVVSPTDKVAMVVMGRTDIDKKTIVDNDFLKFEEEMWDNFYTAGFWRSSSQREKQL